jgi:hypothetical protein
MRMVCIRDLVGLAALLAGCTPAETRSYWTRHNDVVVIHHVTGTKDTTETLTQKALDPDAVKQLGLKKGQRFYEVADSSASPTPAKVKKPEKAKSSDEPSHDSRLSNQIRDLRDEVDAVVAQNKRLQEQISLNSSTSPSPSPSPQPGGQDETTLHLSQ